MTWTDAAPFDMLAPASRARLDKLIPQQVPAGTTLFHPGDAVQGFVIVLSGRIDVFLANAAGREILLYAVEPGQSCIQTTLGLLGEDSYTGHAVTRRDTSVVLIPRGPFLALMQDDPAFRTFVFGAFARRVQTMMALVESVAFDRVEARLARFLLDRAEAGHIAATHAEIATAIGSAREVVSRRLDALARQGALRLGRGAVEVLDHEALRRLSDAPAM
ncbi:Crp/Fnr family transcriptional regulator [Mesobacterium pallidum]|uniref:Crp/Fnr family transcriptional regulator n=1 Tax=Mesobacterium pallidum TaxID=2872037 RepID=UPI001EE222D6|nr:Crp/Fnr family transcriptional regulator [Mesobacterium pallidum]